MLYESQETCSRLCKLEHQRQHMPLRRRVHLAPAQCFLFLRYSYTIALSSDPPTPPLIILQVPIAGCLSAHTVYIHCRCLSSFRRAVLTLLLALPELYNLQLNGLVYPALQFGAVAELEEYLEPNEKGRQEDGLHEVVQQRWGSSLELSVSDELGNPACDVDCAGPGVGSRTIGRCEVVRIRGAADENWSQHGTCDRLHENVQRRVQDGPDSADIEREIRYGEP